MIKTLATGAALALVCLPAAADVAKTGFYVGGGGGRTILKDSSDGIKVRATGSGFKAFGGYRFNEYGSLEATYLDVAVDDNVLGLKVESDATAVQFSALWQVPVTDRFEGFLRISRFVWEAETSATDGRSRIEFEDDGTAWGLGIGAAVSITPAFGLRAEYEGAEIDGADLRIISLAALFRF